jgi:hypothetical protein
VPVGNYLYLKKIMLQAYEIMLRCMGGFTIIILSLKEYMKNYDEHIAMKHLLGCKICYLVLNVVENEVMIRTVKLGPTRKRRPLHDDRLHFVT